MKNLLLVFGSLFTIGISCLAGIFGGYIGSTFVRDFGFEDLTRKIVQDVRVTNEESAIIDVAEKASPSVVSIVVSRDVPTYYSNPFNRYFGFDDEMSSETQRRQVGAGSGFVMNDEGLIITNRHVVSDPSASYTVIFNNGKQVEGRVLARDTVLDIAFIKVEGVDVVPLNLGSSSDLKVGQTVVAIGNALGEFSNTVSSGIISGLSRQIVASDSSGRNSEQLDDLIQTDASINPGNSGGPLLDINGNVIGVNVAVARAENIGFAIPIDTVKDLITRINASGEIERPALGVRFVMINKKIQEENGLSVDYGALVVRGQRLSDLAVIRGSAADKAGIKENDIILEIEGIKLNSQNPLQKVIQRYKVGDTVTLKVLSGEVERSVSVVLQKR